MCYKYVSTFYMSQPKILSTLEKNGIIFFQSKAQFQCFNSI